MAIETIEIIGGDSNYRDNSGYRDRGICFYMGYNEKSSLRVGVAIFVWCV